MKTRSTLDRILESPNATEIVKGLTLLHFSTEMSNYPIYPRQEEKSNVSSKSVRT